MELKTPLAAKVSVVLALDQEALEQLPQEQQEWVEQINNFLERYIMHNACTCICMYTVHIYVNVKSMRLILNAILG